MKPVIRWTLHQRRWSIFGWSLGVFGLIFVNMIFYPSFKNDAEELQKSFANLPDSAVSLLGGADFFSPVGYLNGQVFYLMLPMLLGILAIALGSSLLAKEEQEKTIESLLARPLSRARLLLAKVTAGATIIFTVSLVGLLTTVLTSWWVDLDVPALNIVIASLACFLVCLSFGAIAMALTGLGRARGASLGIAAAYSLGGYIVSSLSDTVTWLVAPSKIFPFYYYRSEEILRGSFVWANFIFFVALIGLCAIVSWVAFRRRDIA